MKVKGTKNNFVHFWVTTRARKERSTFLKYKKKTVQCFFYTRHYLAKNVFTMFPLLRLPKFPAFYPRPHGRPLHQTKYPEKKHLPPIWHRRTDSIHRCFLQRPRTGKPTRNDDGNLPYTTVGGSRDHPVKSFVASASLQMVCLKGNRKGAFFNPPRKHLMASVTRTTTKFLYPRCLNMLLMAPIINF